MDNIEKIEAGLWEAADDLRSNGNVPSNEYFMPVMGILFLRHAANRYKAAKDAIEADQAAGRMPKRKIVEADYKKRRALMLPNEAQFEYLQDLPSGLSVGKALVEAMEAVEAKVEALTGLLPKDYEKFDNELLDNLLRVFDREEMRTATGDIFGRIYEYFLMKFSMSKAHDDGEFFTPPSIVQLLINVIEPDHGKILDPACGSGGMFVQSSHFIENQGQDTAHKATFYGQEKTGTTVRLAKMNLAVHGLEGDVRESNSYYEDAHELVGECDFVMANPPFNVDMIDAEKIKTDLRLPFGLPGVNKAKKISNGNYVWISYFHSYLKDKPSTGSGQGGRAGFVMSSQASSAGNAEAEVRRKLIETGDVDAMVSIRSNFFYTRTVPCELWFIDKGKPEARRDNVMMLDARQVYRKVTRKIFDFSPEQLKNLSAVSWLYRGQNDRFLGLVHDYFAELCTALTELPAALDTVDPLLIEIAQPLQAYAKTAAACKTAPKTETAHLTEALAEWERAEADYADDAKALRSAVAKFSKKHTAALPTSNGSQHKACDAFTPIAQQIKALSKQLDLRAKLANRAAHAARTLSSTDDAPDGYAPMQVNKQLKQMEAAKQTAAEALHAARYAHQQVQWLQVRFPEAKFVDVLGLCKAVSRAEIEAADWSLTPGRYVGVAPEIEDDDFDFEATMKDIHSELADLNKEAVTLASTIQKNFEGMAG
jgi:type I restriction enzyme M protein